MDARSEIYKLSGKRTMRAWKRTDKTKSFLDYARDNSYNVSGIQLSYFPARYYDAEIGKWIAADPQQQHFDAYLYGSDNPVNRIDPDGGADIPSVTMPDLWYFLGREVKTYKEVAPGAALQAGAMLGGGIAVAAVAVTAPVALPVIARTAPIVGKAVADATLTVANTVLSNPVKVVAATEIVVGAVDPNPPENPLQAVGQGIGMALGKVFESISNFFTSSSNNQSDSK
jgi:RHS repeat-associated protein